MDTYRLGRGGGGADGLVRVLALACRGFGALMGRPGARHTVVRRAARVRLIAGFGFGSRALYHPYGYVKARVPPAG